MNYTKLFQKLKCLLTSHATVNILQRIETMSRKRERTHWLTPLCPNDNKPKTLVVFGPMIDSPPAHPDTVMTTLVYLQRTLNAFGMQYTHVSVDLQLYQTACLVQWNDPQRWTGLILHPGMMHTLMSFLGCIGTLMKASGLEVLMSAAFGCISIIINGKAWTNALRAYRLIIAVLLRSFYSNGAKTYQELSDYLEAAREHPTGRLWVDCLIKPTLIALMFLRGERNGDFLLQQHCLNAMLPISLRQVTTIMPVT